MTAPPPSRPDSGDSFRDIFDALRDPLRRRILSELAIRTSSPDEAIELHDVVGDESDSAHLRVELHHVHLPRLDEAGFITWDSETNTITRGPRFEEIRLVIALFHDHQDDLPHDWL